MSMNIHGGSGVLSVPRRVMVEVDERSFPPIQGALLDVNAGIVATRSLVPTGADADALIETSLEFSLPPIEADPIMAEDVCTLAQTDAVFAESSIPPSNMADPARDQVFTAVSAHTFPSRVFGTAGKISPEPSRQSLPAA
jgi:hypothetical protein